MCDCLLLRKAGWHFRYVVNDAELFKKLGSIVDTVPDFNIHGITVLRTVSPSNMAYLQDVEMEDADLPIELVNDMLLNK